MNFCLVLARFFIVLNKDKKGGTMKTFIEVINGMVLRKEGEIQELEWMLDKKRLELDGLLKIENKINPVKLDGFINVLVRV